MISDKQIARCAGNAKTNALRSADDRGVDADHLAAVDTSGPPELPGVRRRRFE